MCIVTGQMRNALGIMRVKGLSVRERNTDQGLRRLWDGLQPVLFTESVESSECRTELAGIELWVVLQSYSQPQVQWTSLLPR